MRVQQREEQEIVEEIQAPKLQHVASAAAIGAAMGTIDPDDD